jgi:hypothetical protein
MEFIVDDRIISSRFKEPPNDTLIERPKLKLYGVVKPHIEVNSPKNPPRDWGNGKTGDRMILNLINNQLDNESPETDLATILIHISEKIYSYFRSKGLKKTTADRLPYASFALAKFTAELVEIAQGGDCVIAMLIDKNAWGLPNLACEHVYRNYQIIADLMKKHNNDKADMWNEFDPILSRRRRQVINNDFAALNGDTAGMMATYQAREFPADRIDLILLFTGGIFPISSYADSADPKKVADLINEYQSEAKLEGAVNMRRLIENADIRSGKINYIDYKNISAIALKRV